MPAISTIRRRGLKTIGVTFGKNSEATMERSANARPAMKNQTQPENPLHLMQPVRRSSGLRKKFKIDGEARGLAPLWVRDLGADFRTCVSISSPSDSIPFMPVTTITEKSCVCVDQLWSKASLTKAPPTYVPVSGSRSVGIPSSHLERMSVRGAVELSCGNRGKRNVSRSLDTRAVAPFSAACANDTQQSHEQAEPALYNGVQCRFTEGIMYLEERTIVSVMLEERGDLMDVLRRNVRACTNIWCK